MGPSGSGKTTLLRLLNGTIQASEGEVLALGHPLRGLRRRQVRELRSQIGFVHQDHSLVPNVRASVNVLAGRLGQRSLWQGLRMMLWPSRSDLERVHELLERVGIEDKLFERTDTLSGGQQQRVAIARALFQEPRALLADEPVASVDPARAQDLIQLLVDLAEERGLSLVVSLHDLDLARTFFPRTVGLRGGRVQFDAPTDSLEEASFRELYRLDSGDVG